MKRFYSLFLLAAVFLASCKSTGVVADNQTHGIDAAGNVWMNPPPVGQGIQIAIMPFDVPRDSEVQGNFYLHLPSNVPFNVGRIEIAMNEGTHHMNLYKDQIAWPPDSGIPQPVIFSHIDGKVDTVNVRYQAEFNAAIVANGGGQLMVEAQAPYLNWEFPTLTEGPNKGSKTCVQFAANDTLVIENHYVNYSSVSQTVPNGKGKVIINLWKSTDAAPVTASMMFAKKMQFVLNAHSDTTLEKDCKWLGQQVIVSQPIYLLGMTGHFHSRGKNFWVDKVKDNFDVNGKFLNTTVVDSKIYKSSAWNEPPFSVYDTPIKVDFTNGEYLRYYAEYVTGAIPISWGPHVVNQEHMNLFVWFAPGWDNGKTVYDNSN